MPELSWRDAITTVLRTSDEPMHYTDPAEAISEQSLRTEFGATPAATVNSIISTSLQNEAADSPFVRVERGRYRLKDKNLNPVTEAQKAAEPVADAGLINAFGMYWSRANVLWTTTPAILGQQQPGSASVNFAGEKGVYLLHDGRAVV